MPKVLPPGTVELPDGSSCAANVQPDVFDDRDLEYRPRLQPLPPEVDVRPGERHLMTQEGNSCTGHAVAAMINAVLGQPLPSGQRATPIHVSPYMLYRMARRYDEFEGEADEGSSLRGALKGWFYHGVLPVEDWPSLDPDDEPDLDLDQTLMDKAMQRPLGAFYRVKALRLDDMQSAVHELSGIVASAAVHSGWLEPTVVRRGGETLHVVERTTGATPLGGHAFAIVGYNDLGFLVQNSWGEDWGKGGFATLPYDDWLQSAYDAWVARPGVRSIVSWREGTRLVEDTNRGLSAGRGPDLLRLQRHVVNLGNEGLLSTNGRFRSSPAQIAAIFSRMQDFHERWQSSVAAGAAGAPSPRRVVLYAHGGLNSENTGLAVAQKHLNWWLNNRVYPITFAWQTGAVETLMDHLHDSVNQKVPMGGLGIDLVEQFDRLVERVARSQLRWMWSEMKENAAAASRPLEEDVTWPDDGERPDSTLASMPGASLTVDRLAGYVRRVPEVEVHLVGHSAGSIFLASMLDRLSASGVPVASMTFLAPAIRVDEFARRVLPHLRDGSVQRFSSFGLTDRRELDDVCGAGQAAVYQKSLLYLVSRALERCADHGRSVEVPLLGMQRFQNTPVEDGCTVADAVSNLPAGELVWAPSSEPTCSRSDSAGHGGFDDDAATMTSVLLRILGHHAAPTERMGYQPGAPLLDPAAGVTVPETDGGRLPEERPAPRSSSSVMDALIRAGWAPRPVPEPSTQVVSV